MRHEIRDKERQNKTLPKQKSFWFNLKLDDANDLLTVTNDYCVGDIQTDSCQKGTQNVARVYEIVVNFKY